jgi:acyl CoA:acetate/3-ketoacid CoA transferase beta subunit
MFTAASPHGPMLKELAPGVSIGSVQQLTGRQLIVPEHVPVMRLNQPNCA